MNTTHIRNCVIFMLLYVQSLILPFMDILSASSVVSLNSFLNMYSGIMLHCCLHQFYMVFLLSFCPLVSLDKLLSMTNFYLNIQK